MKGSGFEIRRHRIGAALIVALLLSSARSVLAADVCTPLPVTGAACFHETDAQALGARIPLLLIHGWNPETVPGLPDESLWDAWLAFYRTDTTLQSKFKPYTFTYFSNVTSLPVLGRAFRDVLDRVGNADARFASSQFALVAHSMGGLVSRYAMTLTTNSGPFQGRRVSDRVLVLVTLGTPHHGAMLANGPALEQKVGHRDDVIQAINAILYPEGPSWFEPNRTDLFWDNYDGALDYTTHSSEINVTLNVINGTGSSDTKIIGYAGVLGAGCVFQSKLCPLSNLLRQTFSLASDGIVAVSSAQLYSSAGSPRIRTRNFSGYDHRDIAVGKGDGVLFNALKTDLLAAVPQTSATPSSCGTTVISIPTTVGGQLASTDCAAPHRTQSRADVYAMQATAGQRLRISMSGSTLDDPYLILVGPNGAVVAEDDDSGDYLDALIRYTVPVTGQYTIEATAYYAEQGTYSLSVTLDTAAVPCAAVTMAVGSSRDGTITSSDCLAPHRQDSRADVYQITASAGQRLVIRMTSAEVDSYLIVASSGGTVLARDDDSGDVFDALLRWTVPATGTYTIEATTFWASDRGAYRLSVAIDTSPASTTDRLELISSPKKAGKELEQPRR